MELSRYPQLRKDLLTTEHVEGNQTVYILKDPQTRRFFRLKQLEYQIARQFNGSLSIAELVSCLREHLHLNLSEAVLSKFIDKLEANHLLESALMKERRGDLASSTKTELPLPAQETCSREWMSGRLNSHRSRLSKLLYWKIAYFDPNDLFDRLLPHVRFLFSKGFIGFAISTFIFALIITINNWDEVSDQIQTLYSVTSVLWGFVVMMPIIVFHELAHGMTCKYFGGEVHEMGFLVLYFQPSCFCNVSDSYLFKERSQRIWVMAAGVFIQSFLWAVLTLFWRIVTPESLVSHFLFVTIAVTGLVTLFQFNPLLKLDGYYILAELFAIPNLRSKSFAYLRSRVKSILLGSTEVLQGISRRDRRVYWVYGLVAFAYTFNFLKYFLLKFEHFFVEQYQGTGFILFWSVAIFAVSEPLVQSISHVFPKKVSERKNTLAKHKNLFVTSFLCLGGVLVLTLGRYELKVASECNLLPYARAEVRAEVAGTIDTIYFDEGQTVHAGDVIARLSDYKYGSEMARIAAMISEAQAQLQLMVVGASKEDVALAQSQVDRAEAAIKKAQAQIPIARERVDYATKNFERSKRMFDEKLLASMSFDEAQRDLNIRKRELDEVQHDVEEKRRQYQEAKKSLAKVLAGTRPEEIEAKRAEIEGLRSQVKLLEKESSYTAIRSPIDGVITTHFLKQKEKAFLQQGDVICQVADTRKILTEIPVPEKEVGDVKIGYEVRLKANAYPNREFSGYVTQISDIADQHAKDVRVLIVRSEINNPDLLLKPEMTGYAKIYCGKRTIGELVTRRMVRFIRTEFWSWF